MPTQPTTADIPTRKALNVVLRQALATRYGTDVNQHPHQAFTFSERTLDAVVRSHPHPAARAIAKKVLRQGIRDEARTDGDGRVAMTMGLGAALVVVAVIYDAAEIDEDAELMLDDAAKIELSIRDTYAVTGQEFLATADAILAA